MANAVTGPTPRWPLLHFLLHLPVQLLDFLFQSVQHGQQALPPDGSVGQQFQLLQFRSPHFRPKLALPLHPLAQRQRMQLVLGARPGLHLLVPMHQQLPHVPLLQRRHPDARKPILHQQGPQLLRVPPVGLLLAHFHGPDPRRIPHPQLVSALRQQALEPGIMPAGLHPYPHRLPRQRAVELLGLRPMAQRSFLILSRSFVKDRDLLKPRMKITAYNQHDVGSFAESLGRLSQLPSYSPQSSQRRYAIKRRILPRRICVPAGSIDTAGRCSRSFACKRRRLQDDKDFEDSTDAESSIPPLSGFRNNSASSLILTPSRSKIRRISSPLVPVPVPRLV